MLEASHGYGLDVERSMGRGTDQRPETGVSVMRAIGAEAWHGRKRPQMMGSYKGGAHAYESVSKVLSNAREEASDMEYSMAYDEDHSHLWQSGAQTARGAKERPRQDVHKPYNAFVTTRQHHHFKKDPGLTKGRSLRNCQDILFNTISNLDSQSRGPRLEGYQPQQRHQGGGASMGDFLGRRGYEIHETPRSRMARR